GLICTSVLGTSVLAVWLIGSAWAVPSQEDIDLCNKKGPEVSLRTSKGAHPTSPPVATERSTARGDEGGKPKPDSGDGNRQPDKTAGGMSTIGMAPMGEKDGVYRFAYTACLHQRGE